MNSFEVHGLIHPFQLSRFLFFAHQVAQLFFVILYVFLIVVVHLSEFVALFNELGVLSQDTVDVLFSHLFVVYSDIFDHLELLLHPSRLPLQLFIHLLSCILFLSSFSLAMKLITCLICLFNQAFQPLPYSLGVIVRVGNRSHL